MLNILGSWVERGWLFMSFCRQLDIGVGLIAAAQRVEHYEIAGYGTVRTYARLLGNSEAERLLQETLNEEAETDKKLTTLAEEVVNLQAV